MPTKIGKKDCVGWSEKWNAWFACPVLFVILMKGEKNISSINMEILKRATSSVATVALNLNGRKGTMAKATVRMTKNDTSRKRSPD